MNTQNQIILLVLILALIGVAGFVVYGKNAAPSYPSQSSLSFEPTKTPEQNKAITPIPEPIVYSWKEYSNDKYQFAFQRPDGWNEQEFTPSAGGLIVAFSPNTLPCATCTYSSDGYFSIKVYNQQTDTLSYVDFTNRMKNAQNNKEVQQVKMGEDKGLLSATVLSIDHKGWIYELSLDKASPKTRFQDSKIFQKVLNSFRFTNLVFNP